MKVWRAAVRLEPDGTVGTVNSKMDVDDLRWREIVELYDGYTFKHGSWWYIEVVEDDDGNMVAT